MDAYVKALARKVKGLKPDQSLICRNNARKRVKKAALALLYAMDREFPRMAAPIKRSARMTHPEKLRHLIKNGYIFVTGATIQQVAAWAAAGVPIKYIGNGLMGKAWAWSLKDLPPHELKKAAKSPNHRKILLATQALKKAAPP